MGDAERIQDHQGDSIDHGVGQLLEIELCGELGEISRYRSRRVGTHYGWYG
jgi:hypothetical protein